MEDNKLIIALEVEVRNVKAQLKEHIRLQEIQFKSLDEKLDEVAKILQNRLPLWATLLISMLMASVGYLSK